MWGSAALEINCSPPSTSPLTHLTLDFQRQVLSAEVLLGHCHCWLCGMGMTVSRAWSSWTFLAGVSTTQGREPHTHYHNISWYSVPAGMCQQFLPSSPYLNPIKDLCVITRGCIAKADRFPNPDLEGDSPGDDQEYAQML